MRMFSDIYSYSKFKSSAVLTPEESGKAKKKEPTSNSWNWYSTKGKQTYWYQKSWKDNMPSMVPASWKVNISWNPRKWFQNIAFPKWSMPTCSCISMTAITNWFHMIFKQMEMAGRYVQVSIMDLQRSCRHRIGACPCFKYLKFDSNPKYASLPWCKRAYFVMRDHVQDYMSAGRSYYKAYYESRQPQENSPDFIQESVVRDSQPNAHKQAQEPAPEEKNEIKHSQSSKYSIDVANSINAKKLKKTNTEDIKGNEEAGTNTHIGTSVSELSKNDSETKKDDDSSVAHITKSDSVYIDAKEEPIPETTEAPKDSNEGTNVSNSNEIDSKSEQKPKEEKSNEDNSKFIIKKTWDRFSKIIS